MNILGKIKKNALSNPGRVAFHSRFGTITYGKLWDSSDRLAAWLDDRLEDSRKPVVVYGHKDPMMLICFLACVKSGRAYCPVDTSMPEERVISIIEKVDNSLVLAAAEFDMPGYFVADKGILSGAMNYDHKISEDRWVFGDDIFYIIFTSGSTGTPKGVQITSDNLSNYVDWSGTLGDNREAKAGGVFMNQAPFSFDLSVMDLYTSLATGGTLWSIDKGLQRNVKSMFSYMEEGNLNYWVSTPSFADMCLADPSFSSDLLPELRTFLFCGEKLTKVTASQLMDRFPNTKIINTYGPTESTVAVTSVEVTREMIESERCIPIGMPKPGTEIRIVREDGTIAAHGGKGEIQIIGNTVSPGYFLNEAKTSEVFSLVDYEDRTDRAYMTGDEGFIANDGMLYYSGRIDLQVKLHGYRIELGDIENNLTKIDGVSSAAVIPKWDKDRIKYLIAFVTSENAEGTYDDRKKIKEHLRNMLPDYMVPKKISFIDTLPLTNNGKADRRKLEEMI